MDKHHYNYVQSQVTLADLITYTCHLHWHDYYEEILS